MSKTILITGSTDGIGKLAAFNLAKAGHNVIFHGRNARKLEAVMGELREESADVNISAVKASHPQIDVLINNAGVFLSGSPRDDKGMDIRFVVNYLAPILLTQELLPVLAAGNATRVINVSSAAQLPVSLSDLQGGQVLADQAAYAQSKLAFTMWNSAMAERHQGLTFIAVNPGSLLNTKMVQEAFGKYWSPADKGADILVELATSAKHSTMSGKYFDNDRGSYGPAHADAYDEAKINQLLQLTGEMLNDF